MKFIELTNACNLMVSKKFSLNVENIIYFSADKFPSENEHYENCNSSIETLGGDEPRLYYVQETYEEIKELLNANTI